MSILYTGFPFFFPQISIFVHSSLFYAHELAIYAQKTLLCFDLLSATLLICGLKWAFCEYVNSYAQNTK